MIEPKTLLSGLPAGLRDPLLKSYLEIASNYAEHRWEPSELNGGKLCEVVYSILSGYLSGTFPSKPAKPKDMLKACRDLELVAASPSRVGDRSVRILIPRVLCAIYEIRNNRGVGHVGGDVDPNFLDATAVFSLSSWVAAELVRVFHKTTTAEAQAAVDVLVERKYPLIWEVEGLRRVLDHKMPSRDQALLLLHQKPGWVEEKDLVASIEYSNGAKFRARILDPLHKERMIELDKGGARVKISPKGSKDVEDRILASRRPA